MATASALAVGRAFRIDRSSDMEYIGFLPITRSPLSTHDAGQKLLAHSPVGTHPTDDLTGRRVEIWRVSDQSDEIMVVDRLETNGKEFERCVYRGKRKEHAVSSANAAFQRMRDKQYLLEPDDAGFEFAPIR